MWFNKHRAKSWEELSSVSEMGNLSIFATSYMPQRAKRQRGVEGVVGGKENKGSTCTELLTRKEDYVIISDTNDRVLPGKVGKTLKLVKNDQEFFHMQNG